jgi:4-diphosphocytidyl-2-C-methyl-D-erythritol kinase
VALGRALGNDLQARPSRCRPALRQVLETGRAVGALGALVSGSGRPWPCWPATPGTPSTWPPH